MNRRGDLMTKTSEHEISKAVMKVLYESPNGRMAVSELKDKVVKHLKLTDEDRKESTTRPNEEVWEQRLRNIVSHRGSEGNIIYEGYVEYDEESHSLEITEAGKKYAQRL